MIRAESLYVGIGGKTLLEGVDVSIPEGSIFAIMGANGAGKTLLLRCLAGLLKPERGAITSSFPEKARAWVPLSQVLPFDMVVEDLVVMGRYAQHLGFVQRRDRDIASIALARLGLEELKARRYNTLSRGEQTKVDIARALAAEPRLILLDEPYSNLDIDATLQLTRLLHELRSAGTTIVLSHHDLFTAQEIATHALFLRKGRLLAAGPLAEVFTPAGIAAAYNVRATTLTNELGSFIRFDQEKN